MPKAKTTKQQPAEAPGFTPAYMVWVEGGRGPAFRHAVLGAAMNEAERLCRQENLPVYVLADVGKCVPAAPPVEWSTSRITNNLASGKGG
jgi:hypothetical protein